MVAKRWKQDRVWIQEGEKREVGRLRIEMEGQWWPKDGNKTEFGFKKEKREKSAA